MITLSPRSMADRGQSKKATTAFRAASRPIFARGSGLLDFACVLARPVLVSTPTSLPTSIVKPVSQTGADDDCLLVEPDAALPQRSLLLRSNFKLQGASPSLQNTVDLTGDDDTPASEAAAPLARGQTSTTATLQPSLMTSRKEISVRTLNEHNSCYRSSVAVALLAAKLPFFEQLLASPTRRAPLASVFVEFYGRIKAGTPIDKELLLSHWRESRTCGTIFGGLDTSGGGRDQQCPAEYAIAALDVIRFELEVVDPLLSVLGEGQHSASPVPLQLAELLARLALESIDLRVSSAHGSRFPALALVLAPRSDIAEPARELIDVGTGDACADSCRAASSAKRRQFIAIRNMLRGLFALTLRQPAVAFIRSSMRALSETQSQVASAMCDALTQPGVPHICTLADNFSATFGGAHRELPRPSELTLRSTPTATAVVEALRRAGAVGGLFDLHRTQSVRCTCSVGFGAVCGTVSVTSGILRVLPLHLPSRPQPEFTSASTAAASSLLGITPDFVQVCPPSTPASVLRRDKVQQSVPRSSLSTGDVSRKRSRQQFIAAADDNSNLLSTVTLPTLPRRLETATPLVDLIVRFLANEALSGTGAYSCSSCQAAGYEKADTTKTSAVSVYPSILMLQLMRFAVIPAPPGGSKKSFDDPDGPKAVRRSDHIVIPELLDLPPSVAVGGVGGARYNLFCVIMHDGFRVSSGHYTCLALGVAGSADTWHDFDDWRVTRVENIAERLLRADVQRSAYVLFYRRAHGAAS